MNLNKWIGAGNLTADPELRYLPKGTAVCNFNIAINRKWKDDTGQQKEDATFVGITAWGKQAETISQYFKRGKSIFIEGRLTQENFEHNGQKRSKTFVTLESFQFPDSGGSREGAPDRPATPARPATAGVPTRFGNRPAAAPAAEPASETPAVEDDCPF